MVDDHHLNRQFLALIFANPEPGYLNVLGQRQAAA